MQPMLAAAYSRVDVILCGLIAFLVVGSLVGTSGDGWEENISFLRSGSSEAKEIRFTIRLSAFLLAALLFFGLCWQ
jgi:hypothetical protein